MAFHSAVHLPVAYILICKLTSVQVHRASRGSSDGLWSLTAQQDSSDTVHGGFHALVLADIMTVRDSATLLQLHCCVKHAFCGVTSLPRSCRTLLSQTHLALHARQWPHMTTSQKH